MGIDLMKLEPHKVSKDLTGYITYIFGAAKVGKTSLAAQAPDCLLLACERGYNAIPGILAQDITSWSDMRTVYRELKKSEVRDRFKVLIVDTIDLAAKYCTKYICSQNNIADLSELGYGKGYALMRSEFEDIFNSLTQLGYAVFFISHAQDAIFTRPDGTEYNKIIPSLSPAKVNAIIENMADIYGYAHFKSPEERVITLRSDDDTISCGSRFKYMVNEVPLSYNALVKAIQDAISMEEQNVGSEFITNEPIKPIENNLDFDEYMNTFKELISKLQEATGPAFQNEWAMRITETVERYLGKGRKVNDMSRDQVEQLVLIVDDLTEQVGNGI